MEGYFDQVLAYRFVFRRSVISLWLQFPRTSFPSGNTFLGSKCLLWHNLIGAIMQ